MNILKKLENLHEEKSELGLLIGNFDGVHLGHKKLLQNFVHTCRQKKLKPVLITFSPHPVLYLCGEKPYLITTRNQKLNLIEKLGVEICVELKFDKSIQQLAPEKFFQDYILKLKELRLIYLGHDFKLGKGKQNSEDILKQMIREMNIELITEQSFSINNEIVSSTLIRKYMTEDFDLEKVNSLLGRSLSICGQVKSGKGIGGKELVHTANLGYESTQLIPNEGVYITEVIVDGKTYDSITNIGRNPTISSGNNIEVETHLFNFSEDLYNKRIEVSFFKKIRDERKFESKNDLLVQIKKDIETAKSFLRSHSPYKLALIGKNISHSKSQMVYEKLLSRCVNYDLIDVEEKDLPNLSELQEKYQGVSITAPYKKSYLSEVSHSAETEMINTLIFGKDEIRAENTDKLAIKKILSRYQSDNSKNFIILGDGAMSQLVQKILKKNKLNHVVLSRRLQNLDQIAMYLNDFGENTLVINTCSREFIFPLVESDNYSFWDLNYNFEPHIKLFESSKVPYQDGMEMLELQAKYALSFWNLKTL